MCLDKKHSIYKVAKKDLYTIKYLDKSMTSPFMDFTYELNKLYSIKTNKFWNVFSTVVKKGFHSAFQHYPACANTIVLCKIPKGSKYYIGSHGDVVSTQIELIKTILTNDEELCFTSYAFSSRGLDYLNKHHPNNLINE